MNFSRNLWLTATLGVSQVLWVPARAQIPGSLPTATEAAPTNALPVEPPLFPGRSPVDLFRELLAVSTVERNRLLADRSPENRKRILAKVREYESLKPDVRELRLQVTELRWYLLPLMTIAPTNRPAQMEPVPAAIRKLVENRLQQWDRLPSAAQKDLLENEATIRYFTEKATSATEEQSRKQLESISPARRQKLEADVAQWRTLPEDERRKMLNRFNQFFDLTVPEKARALNALSDPERQQLEKTLRNYADLTPNQRAQCIRSFEKFTGMSLQERQQFLKNADRWKLMSPAERQAWRDLVSQISMLPPAVDFPPVPHSPIRAPKPSVATSNQ